MSSKENVPPIKATFILLFVLIDASVLQHAFLNNNSWYLSLALLVPVLVATSWLVRKRMHGSSPGECKSGGLHYFPPRESLSHIHYSQLN